MCKHCNGSVVNILAVVGVPNATEMIQCLINKLGEGDLAVPEEICRIPEARTIEQRQRVSGYHFFKRKKRKKKMGYPRSLEAEGILHGCVFIRLRHHVKRQPRAPQMMLYTTFYHVFMRVTPFCILTRQI